MPCPAASRSVDGLALQKPPSAGGRGPGRRQQQGSHHNSSSSSRELPPPAAARPRRGGAAEAPAAVAARGAHLPPIAIASSAFQEGMKAPVLEPPWAEETSFRTPDSSQAAARPPSPDRFRQRAEEEEVGPAREAVSFARRNCQRLGGEGVAALLRGGAWVGGQAGGRWPGPHNPSSGLLCSTSPRLPCLWCRLRPGAGRGPPGSSAQGLLRPGGGALGGAAAPGVGGPRGPEARPRGADGRQARGGGGGCCGGAGG